jgi:hypothetical protein
VDTSDIRTELRFRGYFRFARKPPATRIFVLRVTRRSFNGYCLSNLPKEIESETSARPSPVM